VKNWFYKSIILLFAFILTSCGTSSNSELQFITHISVGGSEETVMTMEVFNPGPATFKDYEIFDGQMQVSDAEGILQICREAPELVGVLKPGESHFAVGWRGILPSGTYHVTWGAPNYGGVVTTFTIIERDGRRDLDNNAIDTQPLGVFLPVENCEDFRGHTLKEDRSQDPPPVILSINGQEQVSALGTYCWSQPGAEVGVCADAIGIPTQQEPLQVASPALASFTFAIPQPPSFLQLDVSDTADAEELDFDARGLRWWRYFPDSLGQNLPMDNPSEFHLAIEPGVYILRLFAQWEELGDVTYGFLVDVQE